MHTCRRTPGVSSQKTGRRSRWVDERQVRSWLVRDQRVEETPLKPSAHTNGDPDDGVGRDRLRSGCRPSAVTCKDAAPSASLLRKAAMRFLRIRPRYADV